MKGTGVPPPHGSDTCSAPDAASAVMHVTSAATVLVAQAAPAVASPGRGSQGWGSSSDRRRQLPGLWLSDCPPWVSSSSQPPPPRDVRVPTTAPVSPPPGIQSPPASDVVDTSLSGFRSVDCPFRLRVDDAFSCLREDDKDWIDGWRAQLSCSASRHASVLTHLHTDQEPAPEFLQQSPRRSLGPALGSGQRSRRQTDEFQVGLFLEPWSCTWLRSARLGGPRQRTLAQSLSSRRRQAPSSIGLWRRTSPSPGPPPPGPHPTKTAPHPDHPSPGPLPTPTALTGTAF